MNIILIQHEVSQDPRNAHVPCFLAGVWSACLGFLGNLGWFWVYTSCVECEGL